MKDIISLVVCVILSIVIGWLGADAFVNKEPTLHSLSMLCAAIGGMLMVAVSLLFKIKDLLSQNATSSLHSEVLEEVKKTGKTVANIVKSQAELLTDLANK
jgi:hypothetical protein